MPRNLDGVNTLDALGNPIVFGKTYGYSQSTNGRMSVTTGIALKTNKGGRITLEVLSASRSYGGGERRDKTNGANKVTVSPFILFPCPSLDEQAKPVIMSEKVIK
jgi:hypothetical protein